MRIKLPLLLRRFLSNGDGKLVLWQAPNAPLVVWIIFTVIGALLRPGHPRLVAHFISHTAIIIWAVLELFWGASGFRRTLGFIVVLLTALAILR